MAKVITFSTKFPTYHPKKGEPTYFVEKFLSSWDMVHGMAEIMKTPLIDSKLVDIDVYHTCIPKHHTIRSSNRWKAGDMFSPRVWGNDINPKSLRKGPYHSKQVIIAPDTQIKQVWNFEIKNNSFYINDRQYDGETESHFELLEEIAKNDGLGRHDLLAWFKYPKPFTGQIICWNENINY